jgi:type VI secretion system protein ImpC
MAETKKKRQEEVTTVEAVAKEEGLLDRIIDEGRVARDESQREWAKDLIGEFVKQVMQGAMVVSKDTEMMINARIAQIDRLISAQLNEVIHHPDFQKLEASWRGLSYLVNQSETGEMLKIKVMNVSKKDLLKDMEKASEFDQSTLFKKIYEEEFGMFGGAAYGAIIGDYEFSSHPQDLALLEKVAGVAAAAHAPFISSPSANLFNLDSFTELGTPRDLSKIFQSVEYAKWKSFRESEDSRYVALALPHVLMRLPYGQANDPVEGFNFEEDVDGTDHTKYLWGNAAYALGTRLTDAFAQYRWTAAIRGVEGGGLVSGLPVHTFRTDEGDVALKCPTEIAITDRREKELADLGFIPLVHCKGTDYAAFFSTQTTNKAKTYDTDAANANARLSSQLQYILAVSRFAHYLKSIMRDKIGSFMTRKNAEDFLNRWISTYVLLDDDAGQEMKARFPLREARIDVSEIPGKPGAYRAVAFLKPHYQLDELTVSLRLVANLPPPAKR